MNNHELKRIEERLSWQRQQGVAKWHRAIFVDWAKTLPRDILLRIEKSGKSYIVSAKYGTDEKWLKLEKLTSLLKFGNLVMGFDQNKKVKGESIAYIDWVKIEQLQE